MPVPPALSTAEQRFAPKKYEQLSDVVASVSSTRSLVSLPLQTIENIIRGLE